VTFPAALLTGQAVMRSLGNGLSNRMYRCCYVLRGFSVSIECAFGTAATVILDVLSSRENNFSLGYCSFQSICRCGFPLDEIANTFCEFSIFDNKEEAAAPILA
jgi:hypothetical protein